MGVSTKPLYIKVHPDDNSAIVVNEGGVEAGSKFDSGVEAIEKIPQGHKISLETIEEGGIIRRYGEIIGYAVKRIEKGSWIRESMLTLPTPPSLESLSISTNVNDVKVEQTNRTFKGFKNSNGTVGTKNILGITTSVQCVVGVLDFAVQKIKTELLPLYPNVDDVVALKHAYGCGVAIQADDAEIPIRTITNLSTHPNFGGEVMVVGLGCEKLQASVITNDASSILLLQEKTGFQNMVEDILKMADEKLKKLNARKREDCPISELVIGVQCGGSDAFSGVTANPAVGYASDLLVKAGATVLFSEVTEVRDAIHLLTPRAINEEVGTGLIREMKWYDHYLSKGNADRSANPSPGNKRGGLSNIVEKALGSIVKSGTSPIVDVLAPGEKVRKKGLVFAATPASDFVCGTLQAASGIHLQVFTTGRGTPYNLPVVPVIKVSTRSSLKREWHDLIDLDAGTIATGEETLEEVGQRLFESIIRVASGEEETWGDKWGITNDITLFNPAPIT
ncbi:galactarate dehydrogenase [Ureibacillus massiliensis 4400831 = CIP 108448 = CCUG 49529]|uniref:Galactarate dehydratase n=1 Tax=Ureibacillus massiliensis 4400831 = CIP 108448 = CCUG 49529 TaxID=1211035 RepID=A0A0A3J1J8_9BACL|nr:galactarate dehydratase [Ureibacillus massiliensis]KGR90879.1 galactarate dehydrogenase [Ureibacillus massiliensis 4400831 = CIP 108448 = CCUG 49529]